MKSPHSARSPFSGLRLLFLIGSLQAWLWPAGAAPYPPGGLETEWTQPDGTKLQLRVFGDEFYARTTTADGYTVWFDEVTQTYVYAQHGADGETLEPTGVPAGRKPPIGVERGLKDAPSVMKAERAAMIQQFAPDRAARWEAKVRASGQAKSAAPAPDGAPGSAAEPEIQAAPLTGGKVGLTILVQFPDDPATPEADAVVFPVTQGKIERWSNQTGYAEDGNTGSVRDYFSDQSNGLLTLTQSVTQIVTLPWPRSYYNYSDYPANQTVRPNAGTAGRMLIADAIAKLKASNFNFAGLAVNGSNQVLATSLLFAGPDSGTWTKGLWPHAWSLASGINVGTAGAPRQIFRYQITNLANNSPVIGTFIHELGHLLLDYPDLYDADPSNGTSEGIGQHCLMGSGNYQNGGRTPAPINLYLKYISGWANLTDLTPSQILDANLPSTGNIGYRIRKPGLPTECFILENRGTGDKWTNGASDLGIMIWHIDENLGDNHDQQMTASNHYQVSLEQADGRFDLENGSNRGDSTDLFDSSTGFLTNDTNPDADWWDGTPSNIRLQITSAPGASMAVKFGGSAPAQYLGVSPTTFTVPQQGGSFSFNLTASGAWSAYSTTQGVKADGGRSGSGNRLYNFSMVSNPGSALRYGSIVFTSGALTAVFNITQLGVRIDDHANNRASATLLGQNGSLGGAINYAGDYDYFRVDVTGPGALTVQTAGTTDTYGYLLNSAGNSLAQDDDSGNDSNFRISYPVVAGIYYVIVEHFDSTLTGAYTITSAYSSGVNLSITPVSQSVPGTGGNYSFTVNSNTAWSWRSNQAWVRSDETVDQSGNQTFTYNIPPQTQASPRTAVITLTAGTVTATHTISQSIADGDDHGDTPATATPVAPESITAGTIETGGDDDYFRIDIPANGTLTVRTSGGLDTVGGLYDQSGSELAYGDDDEDSNFLITQAVGAGSYFVKVSTFFETSTGTYALLSSFVSEPYLNVPAALSVPQQGGTQSVAVSANVAWTWSVSEPWLTATGEDTAQTGTQNFEFAAAPNAAVSPRSASITFTGEGLVPQILSITQAGSGEGPAITQQPAGSVITPGTEALMSVVSPASGIAWQWFEGTSGNTDHPINGATTDSLRVSPVSTRSYWVRLTNSAGITFSNAALVTVTITPAGESWSVVDSGTLEHLRSVSWAGSRFIAVGDSGTILTSADGLAWSARVPVTNQALESVAWNGRMLVAVGGNGTVLTSADGNGWAARSSGSTALLKHVTWDGSAFRAAGLAGVVLTSSDGIAWQPLTGSGSDIHTLRWLKDKLCATGPSAVMTSPDGAVWTVRQSSQGITFTDVASRGDLWLTVDSDGQGRLSSDAGLTWSTAQAIGDPGLEAAASDGAGFVVAGSGGQVLTSPDGSVWTARVSGVTDTLRGAAWGGQAYVAVGDGGTIIRSAGSWQGGAVSNYAAWASSFGLTEGAAGPESDEDGDGLSNVHEFINGTRPVDRSHLSPLQPEIFMDQQTRRVRLRFPYNPQADSLSTKLQSSTDGVLWNDLTPVDASDGSGYTTWRTWDGAVDVLGDKAFFRFKYVRP